LSYVTSQWELNGLGARLHGAFSTSGLNSALLTGTIYWTIYTDNFNPGLEFSAIDQVEISNWNEWLHGKFSIPGIILTQDWNFNSGSANWDEISALSWTQPWAETFAMWSRIWFKFNSAPGLKKLHAISPLKKRIMITFTAILLLDRHLDLVE
jgi:hypothetical protein